MPGDLTARDFSDVRENMTNEQMLAVAAKYEQELISYPAELQELNSPPGGRESALRQARWMCQQIPSQIASGNTGKAMRWIGFIQGTLWASGAKSVDTMRKDNMAEVAPIMA